MNTSKQSIGDTLRNLSGEQIKNLAIRAVVVFVISMVALSGIVSFLFYQQVMELITEQVNTGNMKWADQFPDVPSKVQLWLNLLFRNPAVLLVSILATGTVLLLKLNSFRSK